MAGVHRTVEVRQDGYVFRRFALRVVEGPDEGKEALSTGEELAAGSEQGNDLVLTDRTVSRHHFAVRATARGLELRDLDSTNGTVLGGYQIRAAYAEPRALIGAGRTVIRLDLLDDQVREELSPRDRFGLMLGVSPAARRMFATLERFAPTDGTILLEGETGTGKEIIAESIHRESQRASGPFVVVDCGAIAPALIESELFGHARGAFTGADRERDGAFEAARGGTLFLDEIGELPLAVQPVLLRALESRTFKRVGEQVTIDADFRVVAATNRDLRAEVNRSHFRADLFYRIAVLRVRVPPLRDRREDVPLLIHHFWKQLGAEDAARLPDDLVTALAGRRWPGNVRELRAAVQRAVIFGDAARWRGDGEPDGPPSARAIDGSMTFGESKERAIASWEADYVKRLVERHRGNLSRSARAVGMSRAHLRSLLVKYGLAE